MSEPFLAEIRIFSFNFPPRGWAYCNGQTLPINQNQALFSLMGTTYGGNGQTTFALPNLQGNAAMHRSGNFQQGQFGGEVTHALTQAEMPLHGHTLNASTAVATTGTPTQSVLASPVSAVGPMYAGGTPSAVMAPQAISPAGGGQGHNNMQPYLALNFCVALQGIFPSRN